MEKILINGAEFKNKVTGLVVTLIKDYNGRWYLRRRDETGHYKSLSMTAIEMENLLEGYEPIN